MSKYRNGMWEQAAAAAAQQSGRVHELYTMWKGLGLRIRNLLVVYDVVAHVSIAGKILVLILSRILSTEE